MYVIHKCEFAKGRARQGYILHRIKMTSKPNVFWRQMAISVTSFACLNMPLYDVKK